MTTPQPAWGSPEWQALQAQKLEDARKMLHRNLAVLFRAMIGAGIPYAFVEYRGEGDSGGIEEITGSKADPEHSPMTIPEDADDPHEYMSGLGDTTPLVCEDDVIFFTSANFDEPGAEPATQAYDLKEAVETLVYDLMEICDHDGYENNDGGGGEVLFCAVEGRVIYEHWDYYTARTTHSHSFEPA